MELIDRLKDLQRAEMAASDAYIADRESAHKADASIDAALAFEAAVQSASPELAAHIKAQAARITRLENLEVANTEHDDLVFHKYRAQAAEIERLRGALDVLYRETADYITINKLGDVHHNKSMQDARYALSHKEQDK